MRLWRSKTPRDRDDALCSRTPFLSLNGVLFPPYVTRRRWRWMRDIPGRRASTATAVMSIHAPGMDRPPPRDRSSASSDLSPIPPAADRPTRASPGLPHPPALPAPRTPRGGTRGRSLPRWRQAAAKVRVPRRDRIRTRHPSRRATASIPSLQRNAARICALLRVSTHAHLYAVAVLVWFHAHISSKPWVPTMHRHVSLIASA